MKTRVEVITDPEKAKVLVDPMRREMLRLLAGHPMTENELAEALGLSDPSVGHHLRILMGSRLIKVVRKEAEEHGIIQKFYETNALVYFIDGRKMPPAIERYFMPVNLERARGVMAGLNLTGEQSSVSTKELEEFAKILNSTIVEVVMRYERRWKGDREEVIGQIYGGALNYLLEKPGLLPDKMRDLLMRVRRT